MKEILAEKFVTALWIQERYNCFVKSGKVFEKNEVALNEWFGHKSLASRGDYKIFLKTMEYDETIFSNSISNEPSYKEELVKEVKQSLWFQVLVESMNEEAEKDVSNISAEEMEYYLVIRNFLNYAEGKIRCGGLNEKVNNSLLRSLMTKLLELAHKAIVLDINIARVTGELTEKTSHGRYCEYFERFKDINIVDEFYGKYPVLTRILSSCTINFIDYVLEFCERYNFRKEEVFRSLGIASHTELETIEFDMGDTHEGGKSVLMLKFDDGSKVVYKPKNLAIAHAYNEFCEKLNYWAGEIYIKTHKIICYEEYTFEEFVPFQGGKSKKDIKQFYINFGRLSALLFCLKGSDFHRENVIASGIYPVAIDLETLIQRPNKTEYDKNFYLKQKKILLDSSIARTAMFPNGTSNNKIDMSAFDGREQEVPYETEIVVDEKLDTIRYEYKTQTTGVSDNQACLEGEEINAFDYVEEVIRGFSELYQLMIKHKKEIIQSLDVFKNKKNRILVRNTLNYARLQQMALHPKYLRNAVEREKIFENMWRYCLEEKKIHKSEVMDMLENDIPVFYSDVSSKNVFDAKGNIIENYYDIDGYETLVQEIEGMSSQAMKQQISIIRLLTHRYSPIEKSRTKIIPLQEILKDRISSKNYIEVSMKIADNLMNRALNDSTNTIVAYNDIVQTENGKWTVDLLKNDFYGGYSGIELFFRRLFMLTGKSKYNRFAEKLYKSAKISAKVSTVNSAMGGKWSELTVVIMGAGGLVEEDILHRFREILEEEVDYTDWSIGGASLIQLAYLQYEKNMKKEFLSIAENMLNKLLKQTQEKSSLGGFAHGYSSLAYLFGKAYKFTKKDVYLKACLKFLKMDNNYFVPEKQEWEDGRIEKGADNAHWCHGSLGIGLSRLLIYYECGIREKWIQADIEVANRSVMSSFLSQDDTLCHGNMGKVDYCIEVYKATNNREYLDYAKKIINYIIEKGEFNTGGPEEIPMLGMFTGVTGIGYELLRMVDIQNIPSVLTLQ